MTGSTVVYPYNDTTYNPIELGASIFVGANKNLWRATDEFGLERIAFSDDDDPLGFWDGEKFVFIVSINFSLRRSSCKRSHRCLGQAALAVGWTT